MLWECRGGLGGGQRPECGRAGPGRTRRSLGDVRGKGCEGSKLRASFHTILALLRALGVDSSVVMASWLAELAPSQYGTDCRQVVSWSPLPSDAARPVHRGSAPTIYPTVITPTV